MITVRSPAGVSVQFNTATWVDRSAHGFTDLYTKQGGTWVAQVPNDWLIEAVKPCRVYRAAQDAEETFTAARQLVSAKGSLSYSQAWELAELRRAIARNFDARRRCWK